MAKYKVVKRNRAFSVGTTTYFYEKMQNSKKYGVWVSTPVAMRQLSTHISLIGARNNAKMRAGKLAKSLRK